MDRWNELIAGHVLGNLTAEESEELAQILAQQPQLNEGIFRLRQTATLKGSGLTDNRLMDHTADHIAMPATSSPTEQGPVTKGAEGWADGISGESSPVALTINPIKLDSILNPEQNSLRGRSQAKSSSASHLKNNRDGHTWRSPHAKKSLKNVLWWLLILATIALGIDNMRIRRSLTRIKNKTTYTHKQKAQPTPQSPSAHQLSTQ